MGLGTAIGAITFTGSIVAFAKLQGLVTGAPLVFPGQHPLNALLGIVLVALLVVLCSREPVVGLLRLIVLLSLASRLPADPADRRRRHAGRDLDAELLFGLGGVRHRLHPRQPLLIITGALVGSSGAILSYIMCKGMNRSIFNVILGGFGTEGGAAAAGGPGRRPRGEGGQRRGRRLHHEERRLGRSSCPATAWRWRRRSMRCARWPTC